jgi:hypothetical protein
MGKETKAKGIRITRTNSNHGRTLLPTTIPNMLTGIFRRAKTFQDYSIPIRKSALRPKRASSCA